MSESPRSLSPKLQEGLRKVGRFALMLSGFLILSWGLIHQMLIENDEIIPQFKFAMCCLGLILLITSFWLFSKKCNDKTGLRLLFTSASLLYLFIEFISWFLVFFGTTESNELVVDGSFGVFNRPCAVYDSTSGYKWLQGNNRVTKVFKGEVVFDEKFIVNNRGYISTQDYTFEKKDSNTFRYMVFGDSYTAAEFLHTPWPTRVQEIIQEKSPESKLEFYSFAVDGGGLQNWYHIFKEEILPNYDFDGIIIATYGNDLDRDFAIMHHTDTALYFQYFEERPTSLEQFETEYIPDMWVTAEQQDDSVTDAIIEEAQGWSGRRFVFWKPELNFLIKLYKAGENIAYLMRKANYEEQYIQNKSYDLSDYEEKFFIESYGQDKMDMLDEMLSICNSLNKQIIITPIPDEMSIRYCQEGDFNLQQEECAFLAKKYKTELFDAFEIFVGLNDEDLKKCFLKYDQHWAQKGSDHFAEQFAEYLIELHNTSK